MFSTRFADKIAGVALAFLQHKCTIITYVATGTTDEEGHPTYTSASESNVPCLFLWRDTTTTDEKGTVIEKVPTLYFRSSQVINEGDLVQNVLARTGSSLLSKARINTVDGTAEGGNNSLKVCELEGAVL